MDSTALYNLFRSDLRDEAQPYLWTDSDVFGYMDDAQNMFCRLQGGIADASSTLTQVALTANQPFAAISPKILKLRQANRAADFATLTILNFEDLSHQATQDDYGRRARYRLDNTVGQVDAIIVGMETNKIRLVHLPATDQSINLIVYRLPLTTLTAAGQDLEIDEQHHRHLLLWMKHLAYAKQDAETYDKGRSDQFGQEFRVYCDLAKAEREKREHKYRTVGYGGY